MFKDRANKKSGNTRLPDELHAELGKIVGALYTENEEVPSKGAILWSAWQFAKQHGFTYSLPASAATGSPQPVGGGTTGSNELGEDFTGDPDSTVLNSVHTLLDKILQGGHRRTVQVILRALAKDGGGYGQVESKNHPDSKTGRDNDSRVDPIHQLGAKAPGLSEIIQDGAEVSSAPPAGDTKKTPRGGGNRKSG